MTEVTQMGKHTRNGKMMSPEQTLQDALGDVGKQGALKEGKKVLVLALDESNGDYRVSFYQAGMTMSECVALCDIAKSLFKREMNYELLMFKLTKVALGVKMSLEVWGIDI